MLLHRGRFFQDISDPESNIILNESLKRTMEFSKFTLQSNKGASVFISHKHSDLDNKELIGVIQYLVNYYHIIPYIDSIDPGMPESTCGFTAKRIKDVIGFCNRFILLATEDALKSMWCNWEVGIADKTKYGEDTMAILPLLESNQEEKDFSGNEYLQLYPYIIEETT